MKTFKLFGCISLAMALGSLFSVGIRAWAQTPEIPTAPVPQIDLSKKPAYWRDARLTILVRFPEPQKPARPSPSLFITPPSPEEARGGTNVPPRVVRLIGSRVIPAAELLKIIKMQTGVTLKFTGEWSHRLLAVPVRGIPARELMDGMVLSVRDRIPNHWIAIDQDTWILARGEREAGWALMSPEKRKALRDENIRTLLGSFKEGHWSRLKQGMPLTMNLLSLPQRDALEWVLRMLYYDPATPEESLPTTNGALELVASLRLTGEGKKTVLLIEGAGYGPSGTFSDSIPFYDAASGQLLWGVAPP